MRRLTVNLDDLVSVRDCNYEMMHYFLDLETGEVVMVTDDDNAAVDEFNEHIEIREDESEEVVQSKFDEWLNDYDCPGWQDDSIRSAFLVDRWWGKRFIRIPSDESRDGYHDMVEFASTVTDSHLQRLLSVALNGKGVFRRFRDVLYDYPAEQDRWYKYSQKCKEQRTLEWLESEEIEIDSSQR